jgi:organic radical activating enzyme
MAQIIEIKQKIPAMYLTWVMNNICTNSCSYCHPNLYTGTNHNYDWNHAEKFIDEVLLRYPRINVSVSGGEPTLSPWFRDLVKKFSDAGHPVGVTSNGARTVRYYEEVSQYLSYIVLSYHPSAEDPELLEKAYACGKNTITTVSVMFDSRYFDKCLEMYYRIAEENIVSVQPVKIQDWGTGNSIGRDYTPEQLHVLDHLPRVTSAKPTYPKVMGITGAEAFYLDGSHEPNLNAQELINSSNTNFEDWTCNIGLESLYVRYDGMIRRGNCITSPFVGKIQDVENIIWPIGPVICRQNFCNCTTDVFVSKQKYRG